LILALTILVAIVEAIFAYINLHSQGRQLLDEMIMGADQLSRSITSATWHTMLADQPDATYRVMETIGQKQGIESIRIFNKEGRVTFSTDPDAPTQVDVNAEACYLCHAREEPLVRVDVPSRARVFSGPDGIRRMAMVTPIYNEPACSNAACHAHPEEKTVLGVLDIAMSLEQVDHEVAGIKLRAFLVAATQIILIGILIAFFTRHFVSRPIRRLIGGTKAISAMELDKPVDIGSYGELEELAVSFNTMQERLKAAMEEINQFTHTLERKVEERGRQLAMAQQKLIKGDRMASLGQLAASVAHEINNPLSGVLNFSMLMQRLLKDDGIPEGRVADFRKYLNAVSEETARVGRIVSDLLAFSRRSTPQRANANLNRIVEHTISLISHKLELGSVGLDVWLDDGLPEVSCDGSQMQQVVINLVMNAAEAVQAGGRVVLRTRFDRSADSVLMSVEDSGTGIPEENLSRIFDPFFSTKDAGKGVGLGLAVVYGIVDAHEGSITVESKVGQGTTFTVALPCRPGGPNRAGETHEAKKTGRAV
jgi:two-component system NtrC family sensor kinase